MVPIPRAMSVIEEEAFDSRLVSDGQKEAGKWGAERFAAEFRRRDQEERWLDAAGTGVFPGSSTVPDGPGWDFLSGPVDASVSERVVDPGRKELKLRRPKQKRHGHVPRPPGTEPAPGRRGRGRKGRERADAGPWTPSEAELARMSPAGRRLYGLEDR